MSNPAIGIPYRQFTFNLVDALNDARAVRRMARINCDIALKEAFTAVQQPTRIKCAYCGSKSSDRIDNCKNCGAPTE